MSYFSLFGGIFGAKKESTAPSGSDSTQAALALNTKAREDLLKKIQHYESTKIAPLRRKAVLLMKRQTAKAKAEARQMLKQSKPWETQVQTMRGQHNNLETMQIALQMKESTNQVLRAQEQAVKCFQGGPTAQQVDDINADVEEHLEMYQDTSAALAVPIGAQVVDDDDIDMELAEMLADVSAEDAFEGVAFPSVPTMAPAMAPTIAAAAEEEDGTLADLLRFAE